MQIVHREFADARLFERMILRFCCEGDSFATVKRKMGSVEVRKELDQAVDDIFDEEMRAQAGKPSLRSLLLDYLHSSLNAAFALIQRSIQDTRGAGDNATAFCLHDVQQNRTTLEVIGRESDPDERREF